MQLCPIRPISSLSQILSPKSSLCSLSLCRCVNFCFDLTFTQFSNDCLQSCHFVTLQKLLPLRPVQSFPQTFPQSSEFFCISSCATCILLDQWKCLLSISTTVFGVSRQHDKLEIFMFLHGVLRKGSAYVELGAHFVSLLYCYVKNNC